MADANSVTSALATLSAARIDPSAYARVFEGHHEGALILEDLVRRFYDVNVFVAGGIDAQRETDRRAARREVVHFILTQIGQVSKSDEPAEITIE